MNIHFPYTMSNYIEPINDCMATLEILDIDLILKTFKICGTDILFMQDRYIGPTVPYSNIMLAQEIAGDTIPEYVPTFITVFRTSWIEEAFEYMSFMFDLDIIHHTKLNVSLAMNDEYISNSDIVNTITLFDKRGRFSLETIAGMLFQYSEEIGCSFNRDMYWNNKFGYTICPISVRNNYDIVQQPIRVAFEYANI